MTPEQRRQARERNQAATPVDLLFSGEGPHLEFVEAESPPGVGIRVGEWSQRDGYQVLTIERSSSDLSLALDYIDELESRLAAVQALAGELKREAIRQRREPHSGLTRIQCEQIAARIERALEGRK